MNVDERVAQQIQETVERLDGTPRDIEEVMAEGRRQRRRARTVAAAATAVTAVAVCAMFADTLLPSVRSQQGPAAAEHGRASSTPGSQQSAPGGHSGIVAVEHRGAPIVLRGTSTSGRRLDLADLRGNIVVIRVWGSWCEPCRADSPVLNKLDAQRGVEVLGVAVKEGSPRTLRATEHQLGLRFPSIYNANEQSLAGLREHRPNAVPATLVLDRQGRIADVLYGPIPSIHRLESVIHLLSAEAATP